MNSKRVLVTGGAAGLGRAIALRLAADGAQVMITDVDSVSGQKTAAEGDFRFLEHDVSDETRWMQVIDDFETQYVHLDVLVNNAGILGPPAYATPEDTSLADWKRIFAVNLEGVFLGCKMGIPAMRRAGGGVIINVSSIAGLLASPYATAYGASKAAVRQLTQSVAQHCAERALQIRCNSVHPGPVRTQAWETYVEKRAKLMGVSIETLVDEELMSCPLRTFTSVEDVAAVVSFLASDDARHITGAKFVVDGGIVDCSSYRGATMSSSMLTGGAVE